MTHLRNAARSFAAPRKRIEARPGAKLLPAREANLRRHEANGVYKTESLDSAASRAKTA